MSTRAEGYLFVVITMCIWGGFTIFSRLNAHWQVSAWDIVALRFALAFVILFPILLYRRDLTFLWAPRPMILALTGGLAYCLCVYSAFLYAPAAHGAVFLNGSIPLCTAVAAFVFFRQPFDRHIWLSLGIMLFSLGLMGYFMSAQKIMILGVGDLLFFFGAVFWGIFTVMLKQWGLSAWHAMNGVAIWSAIFYLPIYLLFLPKTFDQVEPMHLLVQGIFHGVFVVIVATLTYVAAIQRLGAFKTGSIVTLAPFIAAVAAVPLLNEPLNPAILCGLVGMGIGALQPWRWFRKDSLEQQLAIQKYQSEVDRVK